MSQPPVSRPPGGTSPRERYRPTPWSSQRLYRPYIKWALAVAMTLGFSTGAVMLILPALDISTGQSWTRHIQAHGVAQIFGWAGLFLMGVAFHVVPRFRNGSIAFPWPQRAALTLILLAISGRFIGQTVPPLGFNGPLLVASGVSLVLGVGIFALTIGLALRRGTAPHSPSETWLWMSLFWSLVAVGLHLAIVVQMASDRSLIAPGRPDVAFVHAALIGFIANFVFAVSLRSVSAFLALPPARLNLNRMSIIAMNAGIAVSTLALLYGLGPWFLAIGAWLELAGFVGFVAALRLYSRRSSPRNYALRAYARYEWFLRTAYGWLVVAGALQAWEAMARLWPDIGPPTNLAAPTLHTLALGFVTMIIMGMASRMIPLFEGAVLPLHRLMDVVYASLNASVAFRLAFGIVPTDLAWIGLAASGTLGTLAIFCFAVVIWRTLQPPSRGTYVEMAVAFGQQRAAKLGDSKASPIPD